MRASWRATRISVRTATPSGSFVRPKMSLAGGCRMQRTLIFELERDTTNTFRFQEVAQGAPPLIGTLYIQKWPFENIPKTITVTIVAE